MRFFGFSLVLSLSITSTEMSRGEALDVSTFSAETGLLEDQAKLACGGTHESPIRNELAESLLSPDGMAPRLMKKLQERSRQTTAKINHSVEMIITRARTERVERAKAKLEVAVQKLGRERSALKKESLREEVRGLYANYQESKRPAPLTESEGELLRTQRNKWMEELKTTISLSERVSAATSKAYGCLCKASDFVCKSADELNARSDQYKVFADYLRAKAAAIPPASLTGGGSMGR